MAVALGSLNLGIITDISSSDRKRFEDVDLPAARGSSTQDLGMLAREIELEGILTGASRLEDFKQLQRAQLNGQSLKLTADVIQTVVFIKEVRLTKLSVNFIRYSLLLKESLFKQVNACDALTCWFSGTGASVNIVDENPYPQEGLGCLRVSQNAEANQTVDAYYEPVDTISLEDFGWVGFSFFMADVSAISSAILTVTSGSNNAAYDFASALNEADKWLRVCIPKTSFTGFDEFDWGQIGRIKFSVTKSLAQNILFAVDDIGGYE